MMAMEPASPLYKLVRLRLIVDPDAKDDDRSRPLDEVAQVSTRFVFFRSSLGLKSDRSYWLYADKLSAIGPVDPRVILQRVSASRFRVERRQRCFSCAEPIASAA